VTSTGLDQRTLDACLADARAAATEYDDALAWLEVAVQGPMEPIAAEVWAFDESLTRVLLVRHRWRGWVPPGGRVEAGEIPREAALREFREESGLDGLLLETPAAVTVRAYREDWTPTLGLSYAAVLDGSLAPAGESRQSAAWTPLTDDWEGAFPGDRPRIRAFAGYLKTAWRAATPERG
jgi:8-oxo-dGTP diphosphatase